MTTASPPTLTAISYIVLGMLAEHGPATSYDMKRYVDTSVGYFWSFPRSQLYAEPQRLATLGLLEEQQEEGGRRRRVYHLTATGRDALRAWLATPAGSGELRDPGLLRLFFARQGPPELTRALAAEQRELHAARLIEYQHLAASLKGAEALQAHTLRMGLLYEEACVRFWSELETLPEL
ncbi:PadR family transcriptional regulator [Deinococcus yavapaiensis]|nr:PadR family transcriptional regulator [Deinococcus yavapaiensis]